MTSTEVTVPDINTNTKWESPLHEIKFLNTIKYVKTQKKRNDGTARVYVYGLPLFLLILWSLATALT
ncbi:hypothetical protein LSM04_004609 [Trypanosoma melophagium]|uniref:uncharacterized protein n=1 Tax=Trypanosoma melophagium TaxID=715481 RepID=UPI003519F4B2|nr:hypothetical protein LSM04_004609 [Trypanosoma melophagium]